MDVYEVGGKQYQIEITQKGHRFDWYFIDPEMRMHRNMDETAPTYEIALAEAKFAIQRHGRS
ncbi:MAG: hypothetical protein JSR83_00330 [Proteobacteria bacterium]|uniref:hypothetical protein n=1 Tax=Zoogloea sp. TaxID=49181 RepID=UPI0035B09637|nr:hypothetical protein [Pseudomonadota bacterium]